MGSLGIKNGQVVGYGTEIGAFVRLDDLDTGYAYKKIDRAIFLNQINQMQEQSYQRLYMKMSLKVIKLI